MVQNDELRKRCSRLAWQALGRRACCAAVCCSWYPASDEKCNDLLFVVLPWFGLSSTVPFIVRAPFVKASVGLNSHALAEAVDMYVLSPTRVGSPRQCKLFFSRHGFSGRCFCFKKHRRNATRGFCRTPVRFSTKFPRSAIVVVSLSQTPTNVVVCIYCIWTVGTARWLTCQA